MRRRRLLVAAAVLASLVLLAALLAFVTPPWKDPLRCLPSDGVPCRAVSGRVVYVEREDPDGDGDAHLVVVGRGSVTKRFLTVVKIARAERPRDLPGIGTWVSAVGRPAFGQRERIELASSRLSTR